MSTLVEEPASRVAILVPCYNEAATVAKVVGDFRQAIPEATVYVFDNNSTDGTGDIARQAGAVVVHEKKRGKGHVVTAMLEKVDADYYVMVDGDDTYPADRVRDLLAPLTAGEADVVVGQREAVDRSEAYPRFHVFGNWLVRTLINVIFGAKLKDIMSGYRAFTREVAMNLPVIAIGFDIETEMTLHYLYRRWVIREIPVAYRDRPAGSVSKLNTIHDGLRVLFRILSVFRSYKPLTFFGVIGIKLFLICLALAAVAKFWVSPGSSYRMALMVLSGTSLAMSLGACSIGVIVQLINFRFLELESVQRRRRSRRDDRTERDGATSPAARSPTGRG